MEVNHDKIYFEDISNYKITDEKSRVIFFFNNKMVVFKTAIMHLKIKNGDYSFKVIGSKKLQLLREFFDTYILKN